MLLPSPVFGMIWIHYKHIFSYHEGCEKNELLRGSPNATKGVQMSCLLLSNFYIWGVFFEQSFYSTSEKDPSSDARCQTQIRQKGHMKCCFNPCVEVGSTLQAYFLHTRGGPNVMKGVQNELVQYAELPILVRWASARTWKGPVQHPIKWFFFKFAVSVAVPSIISFGFFCWNQREGRARV